MKLGGLPEVYATKRPLHDDWPWPLSLIPRRWTGLGLPMPPIRVAGTRVVELQKVQEDYPLHDKAQVIPAYADTPAMIWTPKPVPDIGSWEVLAVRILRLTIPCYFACSYRVFGRRLHFNIGCKPDVTWGDWYWWFEGSLTWTKIAEAA